MQKWTITDPEYHPSLGTEFRSHSAIDAEQVLQGMLRQKDSPSMVVATRTDGARIEAGWRLEDGAWEVDSVYYTAGGRAVV